MARRVSWTLLQVVGIALVGLALADGVEHRELGARAAWRVVLAWRDLGPLVVAAGAALAMARLRGRGDLLGLAVSGVGPLALALGVAGPALAVATGGGAVVELVTPAALEATASTSDRQVSGAWMQGPDGFVRIDGDALVIARVQDGALVERVDWSGGTATTVSVPGLVETTQATPSPVDPATLTFRSDAERGAAELDGPWLRHRVLAPVWSALLAIGLAGLGLVWRLPPSWTMGVAGTVAAALVLLALVTASTALSGWMALAVGALSCLSWTRPLYWTSR